MYFILMFWADYIQLTHLGIQVDHLLDAHRAVEDVQEARLALGLGRLDPLQGDCVGDRGAAGRIVPVYLLH